MKKMLIAAVCLMLLNPAYAGASLFGSDGPKDTDEITLCIRLPARPGGTSIP